MPLDQHMISPDDAPFYAWTCSFILLSAPERQALHIELADQRLDELQSLRESLIAELKAVGLSFDAIGQYQTDPQMSDEQKLGAFNNMHRLALINLLIEEQGEC